MAGHKNEFAIGRLPKQKIRQSLLAAGPNNKVGIGDIRRIEETSEAVGIYVVWHEVTARKCFADTARRAGDLLSRAVVEGHDQLKPGIAAGKLFGFDQETANV